MIIYLRAESDDKDFDSIDEEEDDDEIENVMTDDW